MIRTCRNHESWIRRKACFLLPQLSRDHVILMHCCRLRSQLMKLFNSFPEPEFLAALGRFFSVSFGPKGQMPKFFRFIWPEGPNAKIYLFHLAERAKCQHFSVSFGPKGQMPKFSRFIWPERPNAKFFRFIWPEWPNAKFSSCSFFIINSYMN